MQLSIFSLVEPPANHSASPDCARGWMIRVVTSCSSILRLLADIGPAGWYGRTSPACCLIKEMRLEPSSGGWQNSGMGSPTEFWTLNTCEHNGLDGLSLSDDGVCSLSDILETGDVPQRYYLSAKACLGILRRAEKRGKALPPLLARALKVVAGSAPISTAMEG